MKCSVFIATSLDGYIAKPDGGLDWLLKFEGTGEDYGYNAFAATLDAMVMGRGTYDAVFGFPEWPYKTRVVVLTRRPAELRPGVELADGDVREVARRLAADGAQRVYIDGGDVIRQFLAADLIDDMTVSVIPVLLGDGIRLFDRGIGEHGLELTASQSWPSGLVQLRYQLKSRR